MKQLSILALLSLALFSCKKSDTTEEAQSGNFTITGVRDVDLSLTSNGSYSFPISVVPSGSTKDTVTLSGDLLPGGVYANFQPQTGTTPFTSIVTISTIYSSPGGVYAIKLKGVGHSGTRSYAMNVTLPDYRGWKLGPVVYDKVGLNKDAGNGSTYPRITVDGPGGQTLVLSFAAKAGLPLKTSNYRIAGDSATVDNIQITMYDSAHIYRATGYNSSDGTKGVYGTFTFDTLKRFTFRCANVEMTDGLKKLPLECNFSE